MNLFKYYSFAALIPAAFTLLSTVIFSIFENRDYKSEWITADDAIFLSIATSIIYSRILCTACLPVFLVRINSIKKSGLLTAMSWFLLPFANITTAVIHDINLSLTYPENLNSDLVYLGLLNIPFVAGITASYFRYRKNNPA